MRVVRSHLIHAAGNLASFLWSWRLKVYAHVLLTDAVRRNDAKLTAVCMRDSHTQGNVSHHAVSRNNVSSTR
jgi:hypothetical protein